MIKIIKQYNFSAKDLAYSGPRRGFVIPVPEEPGYSIIVAETDSSVNHEHLGDNFIYMSDEELVKVVGEQKYKNNEEFEKTLNKCRKIREDYKQCKDEYPSSRKDFLIYEKGTVAFDAKSMSGRTIAYRDNSKKFRISSQTDRIVCDFMMNNWRPEPVPEDSKNASTKFF